MHDDIDNNGYDIVLCRGNDMADAVSKLKKEVNDRILDGWDPIGGVSTTEDYRQSGARFYYASQAIIKK